ncbi:hypothetical protein F4824DRAFT_496907 [Ustulina deusta]|nr:hypothetical protein F4824DRAFT_496907 [Ustulina deusta]
MSSANPDLGFVPFSEATRVDKLDSHTYKVELNYALRIIPDLLTSYFEFFAQTTVERAIMVKMQN